MEGCFVGNEAMDEQENPLFLFNAGPPRIKLRWAPGIASGTKNRERSV